MKAMILAAGLGTRLRPHTLHTPKALFPLGDKSLLERTIERLIGAGCQAIMINTHHLADCIEKRLSQLAFPIPVLTRHEPQILGTGGALKNIADFWGDEPLLVVNADIDTDLDFADIYQHHLANQCEVTMALHHCPPYNNVVVNKSDFITDFLDYRQRQVTSSDSKLMAYTGIQVVDPMVANLIRPGQQIDIITIYRDGLQNGMKIKAYRPSKLRWHDIGTAQGYRQAVIDHLAPEAFLRLHGKFDSKNLVCLSLAGDGSDRLWFRLQNGSESVIVADHGIRPVNGSVQADAFVAIGRHLKSKNVPVPTIALYDKFSGLVFLEDLGDQHLQAEIQGSDPGKLRRLYQDVILIWSRMAISAAEDFRIDWTWQTSHYDKAVIMENECCYYLESFIKGYLAQQVDEDSLEKDFKCLAEMLMGCALEGFIHRDFQSRNIMLTAHGPVLIDFQGARLGPIQYDLASLLIDPYTGIAPELQQELLNFAVECIAQGVNLNHEKFLQGYHLCAVSRNLQILGAFAYLSKVKGKDYFRKYIPAAMVSLVVNLEKINARQLLPALWSLAYRTREKIN